jgi:hypothetical protein
MIYERAFPVPNDANVNQQEGMTLRDYFAAKAMQAMLSSPNCPMSWTDEMLAKQAYMTADTMLKERKET